MRIRFAIFIHVILLMSTLFSQIPGTMDYQGKLTDILDVGINDTVQAKLIIYNAEFGGDSIWGEVISNVPVERGLFNVVLGLVNPIGLPFDRAYWLSVEVDGDLLLPRVGLTSSPYAFRASSTDRYDHGFDDHVDVDLTGLEDEDLTWWDEPDSNWRPLTLDSLGALLLGGGGGSYLVTLVGDVTGSGYTGTNIATDISPNAVGNVEIAGGQVRGAAGSGEIALGTVTGHASAFGSDIAVVSVQGHGGGISDIAPGTITGHGAAGLTNVDIALGTVAGGGNPGGTYDITSETIVGHGASGALSIDIKEESITGHGETTSDIKPETIVGHDASTPDIKAHTIIGHAGSSEDVDIKIETVQGHGVGIGDRSDIKYHTIIGHYDDYAQADIKPESVVGHANTTTSDILANTISVIDVYPDIVSSCDDVHNDGGNIDFVPKRNIVIEPHDAANEIWWSTKDTVDFDMVTTEGLRVNGPARIDTLYILQASFHEGPEEYHGGIDLVNPHNPGGSITHLDEDGVNAYDSSTDRGVLIHPHGIVVYGPDANPLAGFKYDYGLEGDMEMFAESWQIVDGETGDVNAHMYKNGELVAHSCTLASHLVVAPGADHETVINADGIEVSRTAEEEVAGWLGKLAGVVPGIPGPIADLFSTVADGGKPALITTRSYGRRLLWADESAELYFFDRGRGALLNGVDTVFIDPIFLETVTINDTTPYLVQLTPEADCNGLWVEKNPTYFIVRELSGGTRDLYYAWEIQAKRMDWDSVRLPQFVDP